MGLPSALFIVFLVLKLVHEIDWSWWWITAPLWIEGGIAFLTIAGVGTAAVISARRS